MELLTVIQPKVFSSLTPGKIASSFKLGEGDPPRMGIRTAEVVEGFYSFPGFTRLTSAQIIQRAVARGVLEGAFGYYNGTPPSQGDDGRYQVSTAKVAFEKTVAEDEIDLDLGFLIMPGALPHAKPPEIPSPEPGAAAPQPPSAAEPTPGQEPIPAPGPGIEKSVNISFTADSSQLFKAWQAVANLAEMAGKITVNINASSEAGFDKNKLRNAVIEPLQEADLIE
jgi:hypothetical protein